MNLWAAIVRIVELFVSGGKPGYALIIVLASSIMLMTVAVVGFTFGRGSIEGLLTAATSPVALEQPRNQAVQARLLGA